MLNFTVGPVQSSEDVLKIGSEQVPYFRTQEFSDVMFENERLIKKFTYASDDSRVVFITGSGTASMEAVIMNTLSTGDKVLVINGGSFGQRFVDLCKLHDINCTEIKLEYGKSLTENELNEYENCGYTALLVNIHETSTGVLYNQKLLSDFCKNNNMFFIVDAISSFLADSINMDELGIDVMITGSQKALACAPGISVIVLSEQALKRVENNSCQCMYFDLKSALKNAERGQTPFTPAVSILRQINVRLRAIERCGGVEYEVDKVKSIANDFRTRVKKVALPFEFFSDSMSNAVTALSTKKTSAYDVFMTLKNNYDIWVCPNGGELANKVFRVGHIGELSIDENTKLINALMDMRDKGLL